MLSKMLIAACLVVGAFADPHEHERGRECFDGIDNDGDGKSDCNDSDCERDPRIHQRCQRMKRREARRHGETGKQCFDDIDNDGDGVKDCEDPDCQKHKEGRICRKIESLGNQIIHGRTDVGTPQGCVHWFDGCNNCKRQRMEDAMTCEKKTCFRQGNAECRAYDRAYRGHKDTGTYDITDLWRKGGPVDALSTRRRTQYAGLCRCGNCMNGDCKPCGGSCWGSGARSCECGSCNYYCHCGNRNSYYKCRQCCAHRRLLDINSTNSTIPF